MKSTETASQTLIASIREARDQCLLIVGTSLDLTKAYDVLKRDTLLDKLNLYGIRGNLNL